MCGAPHIFLPDRSVSAAKPGGQGDKMVFFHVAAFAVLVLFISYKSKEELVDTIPMGVCILTLILYGLSFVNGLSGSDYVAAFGCLFAALCFLGKPKERRAEILGYCAGELKKPSAILAIIMLTAVPLLASGKAVTWWDDYNFWATDAKSLFYLDGFAGKYRNVAPEFGDYPPGTQMMKWWFAHFNPSEFKEGLMFAGYYFMNLSFLVPLFKFVKRKNIALMAAAAAGVWLFPTCAEVFGCDGCCADLTMAVIYGAFLASVVDRDHGRLFYYGRQTLLLTVLMLCKNTAPLWAGFGIAFAVGYHVFLVEKEEKTGTDRWCLFMEALLPALAEASWLLFCLLNRRVAKLTGTALHMAAGSIRIPDIKRELVDSFLTAFIRYPLHRWSTPAVDLSPLALYLLIPLFVFILVKRGKIDRRQGWYLGIFAAVSGACFYGINLVSHLTIFAAESQYLDPFAMVSSIERYGAPFTIGSLYLTAHLSMSRAGGRREGRAGRPFGELSALIFCLGFVFVTADYQSAFRALFGYRSTVSQTLSEREEIVDASARAFLEKAGAGERGNSARVLYLRDISDVSWVRNTYISFEASPISVMYGNVDAASMGPQEVLGALRDSHAEYLYADEIKNGDKLLAALTAEGSFEYGCLYRLVEEAGDARLVKVEGYDG